MMKFSLEEDINIDITTDDVDDVDINEQQENSEDAVEQAEEEIDTADSTIDYLRGVHKNFLTMHRHIQMFGITREFLHLVNSNNNFGSAIGLTLPYYEEDGELGKENDKVTEIEVPEEAEIEMAMEGIVEGLKKVYNKLKDGVTSAITATERFFKVCIATLGIYTKKLNEGKKLFNVNIDEEAFANAKGKFYTVNVMKNILKTLTKDLKSTVPTLTGKEYKFDFCKDTLVLAGYRINVETTEVSYMGETIKDIKALNINLQKDKASEVKTEKGSIQMLGYNWKEVKSLFSQIEALINIFRNFENVNKKLARTLQGKADNTLSDIEESYTSRTTTYDDKGNSSESTTKHRMDLPAVKGWTIGSNMYEQFYAINASIRQAFWLFSSVVNNYINILNKAKPI